MSKKTEETGMMMGAEDADFADCYGGEAPATMRAVGTPDLNGWFSPEPGLVFCGKLIGTFKMPAKRRGEFRDIIVVQLKKPTKARDIEDTESVIKLAPGQILGVSVTFKLRELLDYVEKQGWVWCKCLTKREIGSGQEMWTYDIKVQGERCPLNRTASTSEDHAPPEPGSEDDECPF